MNRHREPEGRNKQQCQATSSGKPSLRGINRYAMWEGIPRQSVCLWLMACIYRLPVCWSGRLRCPRNDGRLIARNDSKKMARYNDVPTAHISPIPPISLIPRLALIPLFFFLLPLFTHATIITVKQDGSCDHTTIQAGINAATTGDTVLVWPGTYFENINYNSKSITVASLYLITQDENYIFETVIDGNMNGSCVNIKDCTGNSVICGFTIQHGSGDLSVQSGGGINIRNSVNVEVKFNRIANNIARSGGGIFFRYSNVVLNGNTICFNKAFWAGGGISHSYFSMVEFSTMYKNNIFMNYAAFGNDYIKSYDIGPVDFIVDTFTVADPDEHFIYSPDAWGYPQYDITIQMDHHYLDQINTDLYVDPLGNDTNSGLSFNDPLKTIAFALQKIKTDSINHRTIFLQDGTYSSDSNDEFLPLNPRSFLSIVGVSSENTIIDAQNNVNHLYSNASVSHLTIKNITFINGFGNMNDFPDCAGLEIYNNSNFTLESSTFYNCEGANGVFYNLNPFNVILNNIEVHNNIGGLSIGSSVTDDLSIQILNSDISSTIPSANPNYGIGAGITIIGTQSGSMNLRGFLYNSLIENNICHPDPFWGDGGGSGIYLINPSLINIINCTLSENKMEEFDGGTIFSFDGPQVSLYNNILYNNTPRNFYLDQSNNPDYPSIVNVTFNNVENGEENVYNANNYNTFNWLSGNIDEDPMWEGGDPFSYALQPGSPCINAGVPMYEAGMSFPYIKEESGTYVLYMLDGDTITLPATDLAGNPRISGGRIDMGAYEWQDTTTEIKKFRVQGSEFRVFPNPFSSNTFISFSTSKEYFLQLEVINIQGQQLRTITENRFPPGDYRLVWNGEDDGGYELKPGNYFICLYLDGTLVSCEKVMKTR